MQKSDALEFWRAVEAFTPAKLPKWKVAADPNDRTDMEEGLYFPLDSVAHMAPWAEPERMGLDPEGRWGFTLYEATSRLSRKIADPWRTYSNSGTLPARVAWAALDAVAPAPALC